MTHLKYQVFQKCCACNTRLEAKKNISRVGEITLEKIRRFFQNNLINKGDPICNVCRTRMNKNREHLVSQVE